MGVASKCHFSWDSQVGNLKIPEIGILATLEAHNFLCKSSIEVRYKTKLYPLLRSLQQYVAHHFHARNLGQFPNFNGREAS